MKRTEFAARDRQRQGVAKTSWSRAIITEVQTWSWIGLNQSKGCYSNCTIPSKKNSWRTPTNWTPKKWLSPSAFFQKPDIWHYRPPEKQISTNVNHLQGIRLFQIVAGCFKVSSFFPKDLCWNTEVTQRDTTSLPGTATEATDDCPSSKLERWRCRGGHPAVENALNQPLNHFNPF